MRKALNLSNIMQYYASGMLRPDELPDAACQALAAGDDSPALRQLAGAQGCDSDCVRALFHRALDELHLQMPTAQEAGMFKARLIAGRIVRGEVTPYVGARQIWWEIYTRFPQLVELRLFVGLASKYEDDNDEKHRDEYLRLIVEKAATLVGAEQEKSE